MFLLIPEPVWIPVHERFHFTFHNVSINTLYGCFLNSCFIFFTFHNVSINTKISSRWTCRNMSLHSTMFLLIRLLSGYNLKFSSYFTFHNVSINTSANPALFAILYPLHSTMFLLIRRVSFENKTVRKSFTFHNVSINTHIHYCLII